MSAAFLILVGGCSRPIAEPEPMVAVPGAFSAAGATPLREKWWQAFGDEALDALIEEALADNFDLRIAWDRLAQAHAVARQADAPLWPQANLQASAGRSRRETDTGTTYSSLYSVGVAASYEVDLWSRLRSTQRAAWLDVQASRDAVDAAAITLSASVANTWYQLAEAKALLRIARAQVETNKQVLDVVTIQFRKGAAAAADVLRQRQLVASTEATVIQAQEAVALLQYTLSVLIGAEPGLAWERSEIELPGLPAMPDPGVPSEVLLRRPDVRLAYRQVQAADQRLAAAIADQYPRISLSANIETTAPSVSDLFDDWLANLAGNLVQPLIDAGRRKAEVQRREAIVSERMHAWSQTILNALRDVETALTQEQQQAQLLANLNVRLRLARQTYERNRERFIKGQTDYIRVLESLVSLQALELNVVGAQRDLIRRRIDLYRSIAGSWGLPAPAVAQAGHPGSAAANSQESIHDKQVRP
jgi:NodT family efflux transporter outer membrane factor (OMF) lipoprotein